MVYFSNPIEHACKHAIGLKTETERTAHVQRCRNSAMTCDAWNERFFFWNKMLYKCVSCHNKTLLSLGNCEVEQDSLPPVLVSDSQPQATHCGCREGLFLPNKYEQHGTFVQFAHVKKTKHKNQFRFEACDI